MGDDQTVRLTAVAKGYLGRISHASDPRIGEGLLDAFWTRKGRDLPGPEYAVALQLFMYSYVLPRVMFDRAAEPTVFEPPPMLGGIPDEPSRNLPAAHSAVQASSQMAAVTGGGGRASSGEPSVNQREPSADGPY